jgi:hypothetical protein
MDQLKRNVLTIALISGGLKGMDKTFKSYLDNYNMDNDSIVLKLYERLFLSSDDVEEGIKIICNDLYKIVL